MNPADLSNALLYGVPIVLYASMYRGFDSILARKAPVSAQPGTSTAEELENATRFNPDGALHIAVARSPEQFEAVRALVRKRYQWRGYLIDDSAECSGQPRQQLSPQEIVFLVESKETTLGTLTLGLDGPLGLRAEAAYGDVIQRFRAAGNRVCELTRLAIAESANSKAVLASLFSLAHAVGCTTHDVTDVFIEVNPRHVGFYSRVLGFAVAAGEKFCERVRAPSVLLQLEIEALEQRLRLVDVAALMEPLVVQAA